MGDNDTTVEMYAMVTVKDELSIEDSAELVNEVRMAIEAFMKAKRRKVITCIGAAEVYEGECPLELDNGGMF